MSDDPPDDIDYYTSLIGNSKNSYSEYALSLMVRGISGAEELLYRYETSTGAAQYGFKMQIEAIKKFDQRGQLVAVEQNQSDKTVDAVYVSGDIVIAESRLKSSKDDTLVEVKYWPNFNTRGKKEQDQMVKSLIDQLMRLVKTRKKVLLLWLSPPIPSVIDPWLKELVRRSFGSLQVATAPLNNRTGAASTSGSSKDGTGSTGTAASASASTSSSSKETSKQ